MYAGIFIVLGVLLGYSLDNYIYSAIFFVGALLGFIIRDYRLYIKNSPSKNKADIAIKEEEPLKEGEYQPIWIKIDKNEMGGYSSFVYNRHGTHLTKENREHFLGILKLMIVKEDELKSHKFKLYTFKKDK